MIQIPKIISLPAAAIRRRLDRHLLLAVLLSALVLFPRAALVAREHCETVDESYHLLRGLTFLQGDIKILHDWDMNDPPLGEAICALPLKLLRCSIHDPASTWGVAYIWDMLPIAREKLLMILAMWKCLLFLPAIALVFHWIRSVYGLRSAWLAVALLLAEPNFTAHIQLSTLDVLGVEAVLMGCYVCWRFLQHPTLAGIILLAAATALAMMIKHTAVILPPVYFLFWLLHVLARHPAWRGLRQICRHGLLFLAAAALTPPIILLLTGFDYDIVVKGTPWSNRWWFFRYMRSHRIPGAIYFQSLIAAQWHNLEGHPAWLWGAQINHDQHLWYYFPVVALYKVPIPIFALFALALLSLLRRRPRWQEWSLAIPMLAWTALSIQTRIHIGFRHFLPAYIFMLMLATRTLADGVNAARPRRAWAICSWLAVAITAAHALSYHPDYISYINWPRDNVWLSISDSNIDWGQNLKQARRWIDQHPGHDPIHFGLFGGYHDTPDYYLDKRITDYYLVLLKIADNQAMGQDAQHRRPQHGLLIASPLLITGQYDPGDRFGDLRQYQPQTVIGHSLLVYDLDHLELRK